jgi:3-phenylpropionate/trans-cinnamate dioxygenase subunit alpha
MANSYEELKALVRPKEGLISRRIFVEQAIYDMELERIFAKCWLYLGHESQLKEDGDYFTTYMVEDPIIVTRDSAGKIRAFLNSCRHRGMQICRTDSGNSKFFRCPYHGWTYRNDGQLVGVPRFETGYFKELDLDQWGLIEVSKVTNYKGMIWGTWNEKSPSFEEYLGGMKYYLDLMLDRMPGGLEVVGGAHKWNVECNWKFPVDNFVGDDYHVPITHGSAFELGLRVPYGEEGREISTGNGHGFGGAYTVGAGPQIRSEYTEQLRIAIERLAKERGEFVKKLIPHGHGAIFPNFSYSDTYSYKTFRVWHPRGPSRTEAFSYCMIDAELPEGAKMDMRKQYILQFGPSGIFEQDDAETWAQCTRATRGWIGRQQVFNHSMGLGHEKSIKEELKQELPGKIGGLWSELNQRGFYEHWLELMTLEI